MKIKSLLNILGLASVINLGITDLQNLPILAQAESSPRNEVTFICGQIFDPASEEYIPATLAWIPQRKTHIQIIGWKSEYFGISNQKRCDIVTEKFAEAYQQGRLNYLTTGQNNGLPIICAISSEDGLCDGDSQLFTLKPHNNPNLVLGKLIDILEGDTSTVLYQSSGDNRTVVSVTELFKKAQPLIECKDKDREGSPINVRSLGPFAVEEKDCPAN